LTHIPVAENEHLVASLRQLVGVNGTAHPTGSVLQTTADGISVRAQGATLTILHPRSAVVSLSGESSVRARYVDEESGEVTITSVYGQ
jgi:flagellar hook-associated protein FlgK